MQLLFDEKAIPGYRLIVSEGTIVQLPTHHTFLIVGLTKASKGVSVNKKIFSKKGDFFFVTAIDTVEFINKVEHPYSFAVLELK